MDSRDVGGVALTIVERLVLSWRQVAIGAVKAALVPPIDPRRGRQLDLFERAPRSAAADELGLVEADHGLGQGIVVRVAAGADRADGARLGEALGVADG